MNGRAFAAMGTEWFVAGPHFAALSDAEAFVRDAEARLSRFRSTSALARLNAQRTAVDPLLAEVTRVALAFVERTGGAFDPRVGNAVLGAGYTVSFPWVTAPAGPDRDARPEVVVDGDRVTLVGQGSLDLGGIAKGWAVDRVAERLGAECLVDGGGDVRVRGRDVSWIGVPGDRAVGLRDGAVATSSTRRRRWVTDDGPAHHIVDPATSRPSEGVAEAVVVADDAVTADAFATALVADAARAMPGLAAWGAEALVDGGGWWMTPGMSRWLA